MTQVLHKSKSFQSPQQPSEGGSVTISQVRKLRAMQVKHPLIGTVINSEFQNPDVLGVYITFLTVRD